MEHIREEKIRSGEYKTLKLAEGCALNDWIIHMYLCDGLGEMTEGTLRENLEGGLYSHNFICIFLKKAAVLEEFR